MQSVGEVCLLNDVLLTFCHRKNWSFVQEFVLSGGLKCLVQLLADSNLYERSQALETILTITDCDVFDWFLPPANHRLHSAHVVQQMHYQLLQLADDQNFLNFVVQNRVNTYPGGSFRALQLLAFWLSWVRALYTEDQQLTLSNKLLREIQLWSVAGENSIDEIEEERNLAATLLNDFGKDHQLDKVAVAGDVHGNKGDFGLTGIAGPVAVDTPSGMSFSNWQQAHNNAIYDDSVMPTSFVSFDQIQKKREEGNRYFKNSAFAEALTSYRQAIELFELWSTTALPMDEEINNQPKEVEIALRSNLANTFWKLYAELSKQNPSDSAGQRGLLDECEQQVQKVLLIDCLHVKANYRLIHVYLERRQIREAYDSAVNFQSTLKSCGADVDDVDLFHRLSTRCVALALIYNKIIHPAEWGLSHQRLKILEALLKRNQLQDKVSLDSLFKIDEADNEFSSNLLKSPVTIDPNIQQLDLKDIDIVPHQRLSHELPTSSRKVAISENNRRIVMERKVLSTDVPSSDVKINKKLKLVADDKIKIAQLKKIGKKVLEELIANRGNAESNRELVEPHLTEAKEVFKMCFCIYIACM
jgi:hypothetical protein